MRLPSHGPASISSTPATAPNNSLPLPRPQDLVLLQEVWTDALVELLAGAGGQAGLSYCRTFDGGLFGAGLMLLSRFPIVDMAFHAFSIKGEPGALQGEALAGGAQGRVDVCKPPPALDGACVV